MKKPTNKEKISQYEAFLHKINMYIVCCNHAGVAELVENADKWSYAHRRGEFLTDKQRNEIINNAFWKLLDTPNADKATKERQKAWTESQKQKEQAFLKNNNRNDGGCTPIVPDDSPALKGVTK